MRQTLALAALVALLLAGCSEAPPAAAKEPAPVEQAAADAAAVEDGAAKPAVDADAAAALTGSAARGGSYLAEVTPEAPVAGFRFTVPKGTAHPVIEDFPPSLPIAIAVTGNDTPEALAVALVDLEQGHVLAAHFMVPFQATIWLTAALPTDGSGPADFSPAVYELSDELDGEELGLVVAARGLTAPVQVLVAPDPEWMWPGDAPSSLVLEARGVTPLHAIGTGTSFSLQMYDEFGFGLAASPGVFGALTLVGEPRIEDALPTYVAPHGGARDVVLETSATGHHWSYSQSTFICGEGAATWALHGSAGGSTVDDSGVLVWGDGYGYLGSALTFGLPVAVAQGDGADPGVARLEIQSAEDNELCFLQAMTFALDQPLSVLLGQAATPLALSFDGLVPIGAGRLPTVGGVAWTVAGAPLARLPPNP